MHEAGGVEFPHGCIHNRETGLTCLPGLKVGFVVLPLHLVELGLERVVFAAEHSREMMADVHVEVAPVQFIDKVVLKAQLGQHNVVDLPDGDWSEVEVGRESCCRHNWIIAKFVIVFPLLYLPQNIEGVLPATLHADALILLIKRVNFGGLQMLLHFLQALKSLKMLGFKGERIWLGNFELRKAMIFEWSENKVWLLCLWGQIFAFQDGIEHIVLSRVNFNAIISGPGSDLGIPFLSEGSVVDVVVERLYLLLLVDVLEHIHIVPIEVVEFPPKGLNLLGKLIERVHHELD